jgi:hypothetical protein
MRFHIADVTFLINWQRHQIKAGTYEKPASFKANRTRFTSVVYSPKISSSF